MGKISSRDLDLFFFFRFFFFAVNLTVESHLWSQPQVAPQGSAVSDSFALPCYFSPWKLSCGNELYNFCSSILQN